MLVDKELSAMVGEGPIFGRSAWESGLDLAAIMSAGSKAAELAAMLRKIGTPPAAAAALSGTFVGAVEAPPEAPAEVKRFLAQTVSARSTELSKLAAKHGLINRKVWSELDRDKIALEALEALFAGKGLTPNASDARIAREVVIMWGRGAGHSVPSVTDAASVTGEDVFGEWWNPLSWSPVKWAGRQIAKPFVWAGQQLGIVSKPKSPAEARMAALQATYKQRAAAKARIIAAEKKHEAAVAEREEERKVAEAEARTAEAESAASEAERIALQADAEKNVRGFAEAVEGDACGAALMALQDKVERDDVGGYDFGGDDLGADDLGAEVAAPAMTPALAESKIREIMRAMGITPMPLKVLSTVEFATVIERATAALGSPTLAQTYVLTALAREEMGLRAPDGATVWVQMPGASGTATEGDEMGSIWSRFKKAVGAGYRVVTAPVTAATYAAAHLLPGKAGERARANLAHQLVRAGEDITRGLKLGGRGLGKGAGWVWDGAKWVGRGEIAAGKVINAPAKW